MPYAYGFLGAGETLATDVTSVWRRKAKAAGHVVTRMPNNPAGREDAGWLAERRGGAGSSEPTRKPTYTLAPAAVLRADGKTAAEISSAIAAGVKVQQLEADVQLVRKKIGDVAGAALAAPRNIIGGVLGWPPWLVPLVLVGGGGLVAYKVLGAGGATALASRLRR